MSGLAPRVNAELLQQNIGKRVRLVGQLLSVEQGSVQLRTSDSGTVTILLQAPASFDDKYLEVLGTVQDLNTIQEIEHTSFGNHFDMAAYNQMVSLVSGQYKPLFS